jgi:NADH:ubiquinone oxidoreductase subunit C
VSTIEEIASKYGGRVESRKNYKAIIIPSDKLRNIIEELANIGYNYLLSISGVDEPKAGRIRVVYHFTRIDSPLDLIAVEVSLPRDAPFVDSIHDIHGGALLQEREEHEMLGIIFRGNPDMRHLLLPPDWPPNVYPLRKDFKVIEEPHISTRPSKPVWVLKPELKPKGEGAAKTAGKKS